MGLRLIKRHFTFSCTRFLFIKGIHSISKDVLFSFIDNSPKVLKVVHLDGGQAVAVSLLPAWVYFLPPQVAPLTLKTRNLTNFRFSGCSLFWKTNFMFSGFSLFWKTNCVFKRLHFSTSKQACRCNWQTQKSMEFAFEMNQLIKFKKICKIFEFCFFFSPHIDHFSSLASKICARAYFFRTGLCVMGTVSTVKVQTVGIVSSRKSHEIRKPSNIGGGSKYSQTCHRGFFNLLNWQFFHRRLPFPTLGQLEPVDLSQPRPTGYPMCLFAHTWLRCRDQQKTALKLCLWCMGHSILFQHLSSQVWDLQSQETPIHSPSP